MIIVPKQVPIVIDSNVPVIEAGVTVWDDVSTFVLNDEVQVSGTHRKYIAKKAVPAGINPTMDILREYWFDYGATNYKRAFDELGSSKCENADLIYYKFTTSDVDVIMFSSLDALTIRIKIVNEDTADVLMDTTFDTYTREVFDWGDWTYAEGQPISKFFKILPLSYNASMEIWIENTGGIASVGHIAFGRSKNYGMTLADPKPVTSSRGITSKTRDSFGNIASRRKARYRRMKITCIIDSASIDLIEDRLEIIADTPCIFVGDERDGGYKALLIYGEIRDHDMPIGAVKTRYQLEVEGYI